MGMWGRKDQEENRPQAAPAPAPATPNPQPAASAAPPRKALPMDSTKAIIGPSIQIKGELIGKEDLVIEGKVEGVIRLIEHHLTIGSKAKIQATLEAKAIRVEGEVTGDVIAGERVELLAGSTVKGDIVSPRISIADGAKFKGSVDMDHSKSAAVAAVGKSAGAATGKSPSLNH